MVVTDRLWQSTLAAVTDGEGSRRRRRGGWDLRLDRGGGLGIWEKIRYNVIPGSSRVQPVYWYLQKPEACIRPGSLQPDLMPRGGPDFLPGGSDPVFKTMVFTYNTKTR